MQQSNNNKGEEAFLLTKKDIYSIISRSMMRAIGDNFITPSEMLDDVLKELRNNNSKPNPSHPAG